MTESRCVRSGHDEQPAQVKERFEPRGFMWMSPERGACAPLSEADVGQK